MKARVLPGLEVVDITVGDVVYTTKKWTDVPADDLVDCKKNRDLQVASDKDVESGKADKDLAKAMDLLAGSDDDDQVDDGK